jgi:hypothetical protein
MILLLFGKLNFGVVWGVIIYSLMEANLSGANLRDAKGLDKAKVTSEQLAKAMNVPTYAS